MADFDKSYEILKKLEFSNETNALHINKGENHWTFMGIYAKAHPNWAGWNIVRKIVSECEGNLKLASMKCYQDIELVADVKQFYIKNFWDQLKCGQIKDQRVATALFTFAVNVGVKKAVSVLQKMLDILADGVVGIQTIRTINMADNEWLIKNYKLAMSEYYAQLVRENQKLSMYLNGWNNRIKGL